MWAGDGGEEQRGIEPGRRAGSRDTRYVEGEMIKDRQL